MELPIQRPARYGHQVNVESALAAFQTLPQELHWSWPVFGAGLIGGLLVSFLVRKLLFGRRRGARRSTLGRDLLALTPALVACLLWGLWLGILAAKSLAP